MLMVKIRGYYAQNGFMKTMQWGSCRVIERLVCLRKSYVIVKDLDREPLYIKAKADLQFKLASPGDFATLKERMLPWKYYKAVYDDRIRRGVTCVIGFVGPQAVGYIWETVLDEKDKNLGFTIKPGRDEIYGLDLYVLPEYRKHLVGYEFISLWLKRAREAGKKRAIGVVEERNKPMLMTTKLVFGFRKTKKMVSLEFFKKMGLLIYTSDAKGPFDPA
jgi:GNAT superfamily N-acetyltransferase